MKLSVVVPCYNEAANVSEFESELSKALLKEKITYEIIFVDDGSTDDTYNKLSSLNKANKNVKVIRFSRNFGKESAMLAGLKNASGSYVAIMDADLQHTPEMLILMYKKLINDDSFDCCCAYKSNREDEGSLKRTLTSLFYKINNKILLDHFENNTKVETTKKSQLNDGLLSIYLSSRILDNSENISPTLYSRLEKSFLSLPDVSSVHIYINNELIQEDQNVSTSIDNIVQI